MAEPFDCPKCGAPISFQPHPGDETVECPYCHETVIIPEDLHIPLPKPEVILQPAPTPAKPLNCVLVAAVLVILIGVSVAIFVFASSQNQPAADLSTDTPAVSAAESATTTLEAKATGEALQPDLKLEQGWPASFTETFTDNSHKWLTGDVRDSYITGNRSISSGTYTWNITTVQSASDFSLPEMADQKDFFVSADMKLVKMPDDADADAGMVFRYSSSAQTWYYFSVNDKGQYYFGWYDGTDWYSLIPETDSSAILIGKTNRLAVGVKGSQFIFLINGQMVDHFVDDNLKSGTIGLGINLPQTGEKGSVEFSNFSVLAPAQNP